MCGDHCQHAAIRTGKLAEARQQRLARWQVFQPPTRRCLERIEVLFGEALADQLAEAIRSEVAHAPVSADLAVLSGHHC